MEKWKNYVKYLVDVSLATRKVLWFVPCGAQAFYTCDVIATFRSTLLPCFHSPNLMT